MCGVAGIFGYADKAPAVSLPELRDIRDRMAVRGPDGSGEWFSAGSNIALAHRRLSVIDLSENASQPMASSDGQYVISFNGEIYNYKSLRERLEKEGVVFKSSSDTEVILELYRKEGVKMLNSLRGMFAFLLWDSVEKKLLAARDPYGIKPLYYADDGYSFYAASSVKALLQSPRISKNLSAGGITGFLSWGSVPEPFTLYEAIRQLPAGACLEVFSDKPNRMTSYFSVSAQFNSSGLEKYTPSSVYEALLDSVKHHFVADVPVAIFLSSGLDSSVILALAADAGFSGIKTVTLAFEEFQGSEQDESLQAARFAAKAGFEHHIHTVTRSDFENELPKILDLMDQPSIDGINTYFVSRAAHRLGLKVALSGLGGDELFGGYPSFQDVPAWAAKMRPLQWARFVEPFFRLAVKSLLPHQPKAAGMLAFGGTIPGTYYLKRGLFMPWEIEEILGREFAAVGFGELKLLTRLGDMLLPDPAKDFSRVAVLESCQYMRNQLLRDADWAGMAHSVEIRTPFVDSFLLKRLAPMLAAKESVNKKDILNEMLDKELPEYILQKPKTGFSIPVKDWIGNKNCGDHVHWSREWALQVLEKFHIRTHQCVSRS